MSEGCTAAAMAENCGHHTLVEETRNRNHHPQGALITQEMHTSDGTVVPMSPNYTSSHGSPLPSKATTSTSGSDKYTVGPECTPRPYRQAGRCAARGCGATSPVLVEGAARRSGRSAPHTASTPRRSGGPLVTCNAARERTRFETKVKTLRTAFFELQQALPCVPPNTKLSKLDVLVLATMYIAHLMGTLQQQDVHGNQTLHGPGGRGGEAELLRAGTGMNHLNPEFFHPVKKWPMRTRLYAGLAARARGSPPRSDSRSDHQTTLHYP